MNYCDICKIAVTSEQALLAHNLGRKHILQQQRLLYNNFFCDTCQKQSTDLQTYQLHLSSKSHQSKVNSTDPPVTVQSNPVPEASGKTSVYCELCHIHCSGQQAFELHCSGKRHKNKLENTESYECEICQLVCPNVRSYIDHCSSKRHGRQLLKQTELFKQLGHTATEIECEIIGYLSVKDMGRLGLVSKHCYELCSENRVWEKHVDQYITKIQQQLECTTMVISGVRNREMFKYLRKIDDLIKLDQIWGKRRQKKYDENFSLFATFQERYDSVYPSNMNHSLDLLANKALQKCFGTALKKTRFCRVDARKLLQRFKARINENLMLQIYQECGVVPL